MTPPKTLHSTLHTRIHLHTVADFFAGETKIVQKLTHSRDYLAKLFFLHLRFQSEKNTDGGGKKRSEEVSREDFFPVVDLRKYFISDIFLRFSAVSLMMNSS